MPALVSLATGCPPHVFTQDDVKKFALPLWGEGGPNREAWLASIFDHAGIRRRSLAAPLQWYSHPRSFPERNARYVESALALAEEVARRCLRSAAVGGEKVDHVVLATTTGISTPSLEARLAGILGFPRGVRRTPIWGLGCAGGAGGLARALAFAEAEPASRVLFLALELCSITFQREDRSKSNLVAAALFGDGAAAVLIEGDRAAGAAGSGFPRLRPLASGSTLWPDSLDVMGWEVNQRGLRVLFSRDIPQIVAEWLRPVLDEFLARNRLSWGEIDHLAFHPGGPRVLDAFERALGVSPESLAPARRVLEEHGNMSSPTCLFVLEEVIQGGVRPGEKVMVLALGPGFTAEYVLLEFDAPG